MAARLYIENKRIERKLDVALIADHKRNNNVHDDLHHLYLS